MISHLRGTLRRKWHDRVEVDVAGVGYEVFLPFFVMRGLDDIKEGDQVIDLEIYYHVTDRQVRPTLIGFQTPRQKQFFEKIITVEDVGPQKAGRALVFSVSTIARAIESENVQLLRQLPGIGERTARKMVATLRGKVVEEALLQDEGFDSLPDESDGAETTSALRDDGIDILTSLGYRRSEATSKVDIALKRNPKIFSPEELIREVYRAEAG